MKSNIKDLERLLKDFKKFERKIVRKVASKALLRDIAETLIKQITARIEKGQGVVKGSKYSNKAKKFKVIKDETKKERKNLKKQGKLDSRTKPNKSNQIRTGKFIDGIHYKIRRGTLYIKPSKDRIDMVKGQMAQGRNGLDLTGKEYDEVLKIINKEINKIIK